MRSLPTTALQLHSHDILQILQLSNSFVCCLDYSTNCLAAAMQLSNYLTHLTMPLLPHPPAANYQPHSNRITVVLEHLFHVLNSCAPKSMQRIKCFNILKFRGELRVACLLPSLESVESRSSHASRRSHAHCRYAAAPAAPPAASAAY